MNKHYHLIGIGGIGMAGLASLLLAKGHKISGSDIKETILLCKLREQGAQIFLGHAATNVVNPDYVVYSSAIDRANPEMTAARQKKIPLLKRAELLSQTIGDQLSITVAGAHGKTTTTSMVGQLLQDGGLKPTIAVGGIVNQGSYNASLGQGKYFVAEVDESDGSFLYFSPYYSIITNVDFEHVDYYHNWKNILNAYRKFIERTHSQGCVIGCGEDARLANLLKESRRPCLLYGFSREFDVCAENIFVDGHSSRFDCYVRGKKEGTVTLNVPGRHNVLNALACVGVGEKLSLPFAVIAESLGKFLGVERRFQLKFKNEDYQVYDDYGHHPTEIRATLEAARALKPKRLVVAFQPHRYTRTKFLMDEFVASLILSDYLMITDIYAASEKPIAGISARDLAEKIKQKNVNTVTYLPKEEITKHITQILSPGDMILTLGAGDITKISDELATTLNGRCGCNREKR